MSIDNEWENFRSMIKGNDEACDEFLEQLFSYAKKISRGFIDLDDVVGESALKLINKYRNCQSFDSRDSGFKGIMSKTVKHVCIDLSKNITKYDENTLINLKDKCYRDIYRSICEKVILDEEKQIVKKSLETYLEKLKEKNKLHWLTFTAYLQVHTVMGLKFEDIKIRSCKEPSISNLQKITQIVKDKMDSNSEILNEAKIRSIIYRHRLAFIKKVKNKIFAKKHDVFINKRI